MAYFWLPGSPENRFPGTLHISRLGEVTAEVIGIFSVNNELFSKLDRVTGITEDGKPLTLSECNCRSLKLSFGGLSRFLIHAKYALIGFSYDEGIPITFTTLRFSIEGLDEWLGVTGIRVEHNWQEQIASISYVIPDGIAINLPNEFTLSFIFMWTIPGFPVIKEAKITQKAYVELKCESPQSLQVFLDLVFKINNFMRFVMDKTIAIDYAEGYSPDIKRTLDNDDQYAAPVTIYFYGTKLPIEKPKIYHNDMLFPYGSMSVNIESIMNEWLNNYAIFEPAFNLYFSTKSSENMYLESKFLFLIQGLETLHRRNSEDTYMTANEFQELVALLGDACPEKNKKWLKEKLAYANEPSLRMRMRKMIAPFSSLFGDQKRQNDFINKTVNTRNYFTHYSSENSGSAVRDVNLISLCRKLEGLFQLHLLKLIGVDQNDIEKIIKNNIALGSKLGIAPEEVSAETNEVDI
ncbi:MAG: HEPN domain-containing protein [Acidithiobacillus sp.]